jgi:hypothetical protein
MDWFRSVVGVAVGFGVFVIGSSMPRSAAMEQTAGAPTLGFAAGAIGYGVVFAALAGLTAASIAGRRYLAHAAVVAGLIAVAALVHPWLEPGAGLRWLDVAAVLVMAPAALFAGWARGRLAAG